MIGKDGKVRKERDALMMATSVILVLAICAVIGATVVDKYLTTDDTRVNIGDSVTVEYVGTYYAYYGEDGAVVFDTTYKSIGNNDNVPKSNDFSKTSFSPFKLTVGTDSVLAAFQSGIVGHKVGDKVRVHIPAGEGYNAPDTIRTYAGSQVVTIPKSETMTLSQFESLYKDVDGHSVNLSMTSVYGWPAVSTYDASTGKVHIQHSPVAGESYTAYDGDFGKVVMNVTSSSASSISFTYTVSDFVKVGKADASGFYPVQMIEVVDGTETFNIVSVKDTNKDGIADAFKFKNVGEKFNIDLYFEITITAVN